MKMSEYRYAELATYNSEVARGIVHTDEWKQRMRLEQELYDHGIEMRMRAIGAIRLGNGGWLMVPEARPSWWRRLFGPRDKLVERARRSKP